MTSSSLLMNLLWVLYAYLMHCSRWKFLTSSSLDEIIEIIPAAYQNEAKRIQYPRTRPACCPDRQISCRLRCKASTSQVVQAASPAAVR